MYFFIQQEREKEKREEDWRGIKSDIWESKYF